MAALIESEMKTMLIAELNASAFSSEIDSVWSSWWTLHGSDTDAELYLRYRMLRLLQGQYRTRYNVTQGTERREAGQLFRAVTEMLNEVKSDLPVTSNVPTLGVSILDPILAPEECYGELDGVKSGIPCGY